MNKEFHYKVIDWDELRIFIKTIANKIEESGYKPDMLVGISKGGWVVSRLLCDRMGVKDLIGLDPASLPASFKMDLSGKKVLLVDDIANEESIRPAIEHLASFSPKEVRVVILFYIGGIKPDYFVKKISNKTIIFPWSLMSK
ncbi:MAG: phosphoribosyltransferase [Nitrososphaerales archaeon]